MKTQVIVSLLALLIGGAIVACSGSESSPVDLDATATVITANILATATEKRPHPRLLLPQPPPLLQRRVQPGPLRPPQLLHPGPSRLPCI